MRDHSRHYREHNGQGTMEVKNRTVSMAAILETGSDCPPKFFPSKSCFYISPSREEKKPLHRHVLNISLLVPL